MMSDDYDQPTDVLVKLTLA